MSPLETYLNNFREFILIVTVLYFYGLAFALGLGKSLYGLDHPAIFLSVCTLYLLAIGYEIFTGWLKSRAFFLWFALWVVSYGVIGLYMAPIYFGSWILVYVIYEPLIIVFMGGFAFAYGQVLSRYFLSSGVISPQQVKNALRDMPGWRADKNVLRKTFVFKDFSSALNFVNQAGRLAQKMHHHPELRLHGSRVEIVVGTSQTGGISALDMEQAHRLDEIL